MPDETASLTREEFNERRISLLKSRLSLQVETQSVYTGSDPLYEKQHTIQLLLDDEIISEIYLP
jgi:hypothetical protein